MSDLGLGVFIPSAISLFGGAGQESRTPRKIGPIVAQVTIEEKHIDQLVITDHPVEIGSAISDHAYRKPSVVMVRCSWSTSPSTKQGMLSAPQALLSGLIQGVGANVGIGITNKLIPGSGLPRAIGNVIQGSFISPAVNAFSQSLNSHAGIGTSDMSDVYKQLLALQISLVPFDLYTGKKLYKNMLIQSLTVETDVRSENSLNALLECREVILVSTTIVPFNSDTSVQKTPSATGSVVDSGTAQAFPVKPQSIIEMRLLPPGPNATVGPTGFITG